MRATVLCAALLAGCFAQPRVPEPALYDLGIVPVERVVAANADTGLPAVRVRTSAPSWLDDTSMHYRLLYADDLQTLTYAYARWVAPPAELVAQRLRHRLVESGAATGAAASAELLHVELEEFVQLFETPTRSFGRVSVHLRLSGASGAQASFTEQIAAPTPDAAGGVRALAAATDAVIARIVGWIGAARSGRTADMQLRLPRAAEG
jgi:cholesterol transport system auxiliary component